MSLILALALTQVPKEPRLLLDTSIGGAVSMVRFSADGSRVAAIDASSGVFRMIEIASGKVLVTEKTPGRGRGASYDPKANRLVTVSALLKKNVEVPTLLVSYPGTRKPSFEREFPGNRVTIPKSGSTIFANLAGRTTLFETIRFQELAAWPVTFEHVAVDAKHKVAAIRVAKTLQIVSMPEGKLIKEFAWPGACKGLAIDHASQTVLVTTDNTFYIWSYGTSNVRQLGNKGKYMGLDGAAAIAPNGKTALLGGLHGSVFLVNLKTGAVLFQGGSREMGSTYPVLGLDYSEDGTRIAAGYWTGEVKVWDISKL